MSNKKDTMKILACVNVGNEKVIQLWEMKDYHIVIHQLPSQIIGIPLDKSRIKPITDPEKICDMAGSTLGNQEHIEALSDALDRAYLGNLSLSDAVIIPAN